MNRRSFLKTSVLAAGGVLLGGPAALAQTPRPVSALRLVLLHTNDVHSHLEPMATGEWKGYGGAAMRKAFIDRIRMANPHTLLLDSGDMLQGTPYFNLFGGEVEFRAMSMMGYDAATLGNHDFDDGTEKLAAQAERHARFPLLNCNYGLADTPLRDRVREYLVMERDGLRIGLLGLGIKLEGLVATRNREGVMYRDPVVDAARVAKILRHEEGCDFIVCLSHINRLARDTRKRRMEPGDRDVIRQVPEIDVVLGGHNHDLLHVPEFYFRPGGTGWVHQSGWGGTHIGVLEFDVYGRGEVVLNSGDCSPVMRA